MNHQLDEHCHAIHKNTRSKRRAVDDVSSTLANQASTSVATLHVPISSVLNRAAKQPRPILNNRLPNPPQPTLVIPISAPAISKPQHKPINTPLNIVEQMKKTTISVPMWDVLAIPSKLELLQEELQTVEV